MSKGRVKKWKLREAEINLLKLRHGSDRSLARPFPDLSVPSPTGRSLGNGFAPIQHTLPKSSEFTTIKNAAVSHLHKSSYQVLLKSELPFAGKKP